MDYIYSTILAIVQAVTEFLPISSTGHLVILHKFLPSPLLDSLTFDVVLHLGTLIALVIYFWKDLVKIAKSFFYSLFCHSQYQQEEGQLWWQIILGTIPALLVGYFLNDLVEQKFRSALIVIIMLIAGGVLFIIFEKSGAKKRDLSSLTVSDVLLIGLAQAFALLPGLSRSGITIVAGLARGLSRKEAARFSFLMAVPVIFLAAIKRITQISLSDSSFIFVFILGAATAALIGYFTIKYLLRFLENNSLISFAVYRFILAALLIVIFYLNFN
jgi:undecaprenyl-diphosphatase